MTKYLDAFADWAMPKLRAWNEFVGRGKYWTLPFGNDGRGTRVYLHPFVNFLIFAGLTYIHYKFFT